MTFRCFGTTCFVDAEPRAAALAREQMIDWHDRFSRFRADSELSRLNGDPRAAVPVSATMARLAVAVVAAGEQTGGLVDGTTDPNGMSERRHRPLTLGPVSRVWPTLAPGGLIGDGATGSA